MEAIEFLDANIKLVKKEQAFYRACVPAQIALGLITAFKGSALFGVSGLTYVNALFAAGGVFLGVLCAWPASAMFRLARELLKLERLRSLHQDNCLGPKKQLTACKKVKDEIISSCT